MQRSPYVVRPTRVKTNLALSTPVSERSELGLVQPTGPKSRWSTPRSEYGLTMLGSPKRHSTS
jgi:hypothetical protein